MVTPAQGSSLSFLPSRHASDTDGGAKARSSHPLIGSRFAVQERYEVTLTVIAVAACIGSPGVSTIY